jgi:biopolymer transport protein ExbB/TolQ
MKFLKQLFAFLGGFSVLGGAFVLMWQYFRNKQLFVVLLSNSIVKGSITVLQKMAMAAAAIVVGLIFLLISMKFASIARRNEREKKAALRQQQKENDEIARQLKKEAEEAKAEAEQAKAEAERIRLTLADTQKEEETKVEEQA